MKVLSISYFFPPLTGPGSFRAVKHAKYFHEFNVDPTIICADDTVYSRDESLVAEIPANLVVSRHPFTPPIQKILDWKRKILLEKAHEIRRSQPSPSTSNSALANLSRIALRGMLSVYFPDDRRPWGKKAYRSALELSQSQSFDLIYSSSGPLTNHWVAARLQKKLKLPWVAEFRDLWVGEADYGAYPLRAILDRQMERKWIRQADAVIGVTRGVSAYFAELTNRPDKVHTITNGFDEPDFTEVEKNLSFSSTDIFEYAFSGTLYGNKSPVPLLKALPLFFEKYPHYFGKVRFRFVGRIGDRFQGYFDEMEARFPNTIVREPLTSHRESIARMMSADANLLFIGGGKKGLGVLTCKIFEYIRAKKPVLLIGPEGGEADQLLREVGLGKAVEENPEEISEALHSILRREWMTTPLTISDIQKYSRHSAAEKIAALFHQLVR
ncbi:MAG: glycosyltransferase [Bdellovibrionales bacterium]|nr:glycosyltransferase [Bdellovibrionales bacterium]